MTMRFAGCFRFGLISAALVLAFATAGEAKEGFYLGGGYASQSVSGGLDGKKAFADAAGTVAILPGKPDSGTGLAVVVGYGFTPEVSVEYLFASTSHTASHDLVDFDSDMTLSTGLIGLHLQIPISENLGFIGRVGVASAIATYDKYALEGDIVNGTFTKTGEAQFTGTGFGIGAGIEYYLDKVGLSANYSILNVSFDQGEGGGASGELSKSLSSTINQLTFIVTYYFK